MTILEISIRQVSDGRFEAECDNPDAVSCDALYSQYSDTPEDAIDDICGQVSGRAWVLDTGRATGRVSA